MNDWIRAQVGRGGADKLGPLQLAWIGDAVWALHQRLRLGARPGRSDALHKAVVAEVRADAQSNLLAWLEQQGLLHAEELELLPGERMLAPEFTSEELQLESEYEL